MVTRADYGEREVEACKSVLVELIHVLGSADEEEIAFARRDAFERVDYLLRKLGIR